MIYDNSIFLEHLMDMVKFPTVSKVDDIGVDEDAFLGLHRYLEEAYPEVHKLMKKETIGLFGLLYHYDSGNKDKLPLMFLAHQDVVSEGDPAMWKYPPYCPTVENGILYGRGTTDCKINMAAYLDALELLFRDGYRPDYDIYLAFGYNEEIMGGPRPGAKLIADTLKSRNIEFGMILDESGSLYHTADGNIAGKLVIAEKGYADIEISRVKKGGHSARALGHSALGEIAEAICLIENNPMEQRLTDPVILMLEKSAPYMKDEKLKELFKDVRKNWDELKEIFKDDPQYNSLTRTTSAVTMAGGSPQANVMPERAWAVINCRILPGETIDDVIAHYRTFLPEEIEIKVLKGHNPPEIQSIDTKAYDVILKVLNDMYPGAVLLPQMMAAGTDSRYYCGVCPSKSVYRFTGVLNDGLNGGTHSVDEHIAVDILSKNVEFYVNLIKAYSLCN